MTSPKPAPGQVWRRKSDGQEVTVLDVDNPHVIGRANVVHQGKRRVYTEIPNFIRKYEYVREGHGE